MPGGYHAECNALPPYPAAAGLRRDKPTRLRDATGQLLAYFGICSFLFASAADARQKILKLPDGNFVSLNR
jgi:hypothetical protein